MIENQDYYVPAIISDSCMSLFLSGDKDTMLDAQNNLEDASEYFNSHISDVLIAKIVMIGGSIEVIDLFESNQKSVTIIH